VVDYETLARLCLMSTGRSIVGREVGFLTGGEPDNGGTVEPESSSASSWFLREG
jgi:hypothetical protein